jgi:hypothetical protein
MARLRLLLAGYPRVQTCVRVLMFAVAAAIACPIRYWAIAADFDNSWVFGLNYAAAHGLAFGRDHLFNTGPLGHLVFAQDVGDNLVHAFIFQVIIWAVLVGVLWDLYSRVGIELRNLGLFTIFLGLAAPLFWFNRVGIDNLILAGALVYLVVYRWRGGIARLVLSLALMGIMPLIKFTSGMIAAGALAGFLVDRAICLGWKAWREVVLSATVPAVVAGVVFYATIPSFAALAAFVKGSLDFSSGYSAAMSMPGPRIELLAAVEAVVLVSALLLIQARGSRIPALFWALLLAIPMAVSFKHGFVRQDYHVINFFCFCSLALALICLSSPLHKGYLLAVAAILLPFLVIWQDYVGYRLGPRTSVETATGIRGLRLAWNARNPQRLKAALRATAESDYPANQRVEPAVRKVIGDATVTSLSMTYSGAVVLDNLRFVVYPLIGRTAAYTAYLDGLCAVWVREKGPRFIIFDGSTVDNRHPWAETPAMWLEVYRWYDTRILGQRNLLLERRAKPRFSRLVSLGHVPFKLRSGFSVPQSQDAMFWAMSCHLSRAGKLQNLFYRIPPMAMQIQNPEGKWSNFRAIVDVLTNPVLGSTLPADLPEFAEVFGAETNPKQTVQHLSFGPVPNPYRAVEDEFRSYEPTCDVEFFRPSS